MRKSSALPMSRMRAGKQAEMLAKCCYDIREGKLVRVSSPIAIKVLERAFAMLIRAKGQPVTITVTKDEAGGFPRYSDEILPKGVWCLATGLDGEGKACYALQAAQHEDHELAQAAARALALSKLAVTCSTPGFPIGAAWASA